VPNLKQLRNWPGRFGAAALRLQYYLFSGSRAGLPPMGLGFASISSFDGRHTKAWAQTLAERLKG